MKQPPILVPLQVCPSCKKHSLMLNETSNRYECLNTECREAFFRVTVDKFNQQIDAEQKALDAISKKKTKAWFKNQYYDSKGGKWRDGKKPKRVKLGSNNWLWTIIVFIIISLGITLVFNYFIPGTRFFIIAW